ncbi:MAG TPA: rRNA maturation RNase YbeY [Atribacterota bacterium]|nr:rRNA maturation RNase YbeY [Atribacterota bacterium]
MKKTLLTAMKFTKQKKTSEVSLLLTDDKGIQRLNKKYRNIDSPTDVLAFSQIENGNSNRVSLLHKKEEYLLGDIVISVETAQRQSLNLGHSLQYELILLLIHGFLHLLGFEHDSESKYEQMKALEKEVFNVILKDTKKHNKYPNQ